MGADGIATPSENQEVKDLSAKTDGQASTSSGQTDGSKATRHPLATPAKSSSIKSEEDGGAKNNEDKLKRLRGHAARIEFKSRVKEVEHAQSLRLKKTQLFNAQLAESRSD